MLELRDILQKKLRWSFYGPDHTDSPEELSNLNTLEREDPGKSYITGILSPQLNAKDEETAEDDTPFSRTGANDSSFGFTFAMASDFLGSVEVGASFSTYKKVDKDGQEIFERVPHNFKFCFDRDKFSISNKYEEELIQVGKLKDIIKLIVTKRTDIQDKDRTIYTVSIVHFGKEESALRPWRSSLFQVRVWTSLSKGKFMDLPFDSLDLTEDKKQSSLLYRNIHRYAIGHGCGTNWASESLDQIESTFFPSAEVPVYAHKDLKSECLSMVRWVKDIKDLSPLLEINRTYKEWLDDQLKDIKGLDSSQLKTLEINKKKVNEVQDRIHKGIQVLENDINAQKAFQWMNLAMLNQQIRGKMDVVKIQKENGKYRSGSPVFFDPLVPDSWPVNKEKFGHWRLFQLAFIIMCIPDIVNESQEVPMDLIWFPTGGGKTEAYLGLSAFLLLYERASGRKNKGVKILMRYTLRLLTSQQFERAASMILALDEIRINNESELGKIPFKIGLWVGSSVTFNAHGNISQNYSKNAFSSNQWMENLNYDYYNRPWPWVLQKCPRCNREFGLRKQNSDHQLFGISRDPETNKVIFSCKCSNYKYNRLPIYVVDEDIYEELPSMVIATVDKFARLPWNPECSKILGVNALGRGEHSKLSLIIQDELHLLEGPLGTIVGSYESAIDFLIKRTGSYPKRIGSSATLAMAKRQCQSLYGIDQDNVKVFPPPLLNWDDNYFSFVDKKSKGRRYVGVYANGSPSGKTTQYKLYASLLQTGDELAKDHDKNGEGYSTLVNYFNSTRDMGQALSLMGDDVPRELRNLAKKFSIVSEDQRRLVDINQGLVQLHGNVRSDIVQKDMGRLLEKRGSKNHVHTVLATNMISVGLDVPRLSIMTIIHQPKTMSEYIQASSRIGRGKVPGIVFVVLSARRARDRSHLEDFRTTHHKMYSLVEPSSLTPFSTSAVDRSLAGVLTSIFRNDPHHGLFGRFSSLNSSLIKEVKAHFKNRIAIVDPNEWESFEEKYDNFVNSWNCGGFRSFGSEFNFRSSDLSIMVPFLTPCSTWSIKPFQVLQAMRNVDSGIELKQITK